MNVPVQWQGRNPSNGAEKPHGDFLKNRRGEVPHPNVMATFHERFDEARGAVSLHHFLAGETVVEGREELDHLSIVGVVEQGAWRTGRGEEQMALVIRLKEVKE